MTESDSQAIDRTLVIILTEPGRTVEPEWLDALQRRLPGEIVASEGGPAPAGVDVLPNSRGPWWQWLGELDPARTQGGVLLLAPGLILPERLARRLDHALASADCPALFTLPGNHQDGLDPAAGLFEPSDEGIDRIVQAAAGLRFSPLRLRPERLAIIPAGRLAEALRLARQYHCWLYDGLWFRDPVAGADRDPDAPDRRAALGDLRAALERLADQRDAAALPLFGFDDRPVVLHISHDWGGGVARWIGDLVAADRAHDHLVLSAGGRTDGTVHGQWLKLYAAGPGRGCVRRWPLSPAIAGTDTGHAQYREILGEVIDRYGVARIVVSSLIGHALDALATGLPTLEMLHDYYPAWPVLDHDPLAFADGDDQIDLQRAIDESGGNFLFAERRAAAWRELGAAWLEAVRGNGVALAAPTKQVLARWRRLVDDPLEEARVIPHGFAGWPADTAEVEPRPLTDGRLNLVVVGRLSPGKGLDLLDAALDGLREHARVTLLGCGRHGMRFFGRPDVDIVLDYRHEALPEHLSRIGAQAVLFLSTVAETWNYVLTETRALGLVPLATRTGSFLERIRDGVDGVLFDPEPESLVRAVGALRARPERLDSLRRALPAEPAMAEALSAIDRLAGLRQAGPAEASASSSLERRVSAVAAELAEARRRGRAMSGEIEALGRDLEMRTDWARKQERLARERTRWARSLESELEESQDANAERDRHIQALDREIHALNKELNLAHSQSQQLIHDLQVIVGSRSWKLTRPLRVLNRLAGNARAQRAWHPARWPALLGQFRRNWRTFGPRAALHRLQLPPTPEPTRAPRPVEKKFEQDPVTVPPCQRPRASIIVPVYNKVEYTANCLNSVVRHSSPGTYEVIVVDDCSKDGTQDYLRRCRGIEVIRNRSNSGFIRSCNAGARAARGKYLVLLNNDTSVTEGWLDALLDTFDQHPGAGVVGGRLVYPDGRLQEAGGIIFNDASGWNYGRGENSELPQYNFVSEADYVSGACLAIAREDFEAVGGFDTRFVPAYYEDTDLCFAMRQRGHSVIYQPAATIIHHEGVSSGTDETSGIKRFQAVNRDKFREKWKHMLAEHPPPEVREEHADPVRHIRFRRTPRRALLIDAVTPQPDHDSGSVRIVAIMRLLREMGYQVSFMPQNLAWISSYSEALQQQGIEVLHAAAIHNLGDWLEDNGRDIDVAFVSRHYVLAPILRLIRTRCRKATLLFDTVDLHFLRERREAEATGSKAMAVQAERTRSEELRLVREADITLVVSEVEKSLLEREVPRARIEIVSNVHDIHGSSTTWKDRRDMMFVGGFQHLPNVDAALWLVEDIFPRIRREMPEVRLHLIGSRMPEEVANLDEPGVEVHGFVADLDPFLEGCRLSLAPLRYGAGVKGKVNQAMSHGLPVVATSCASEGMFLEHERDVLIADKAEDFARQAVRAYRDEALWNRLSEGGLNNVERHFSVQAAREALQRTLDDAK